MKSFAVEVVVGAAEREGTSEVEAAAFEIPYNLVVEDGAKSQLTPGKKFLFRNGDAHQNGRRHENRCVKSSSQLRGEHCKSSSDFFPSECPGLCST